MAVKKISPWSFTVATIIPVWREPAIRKVLSRFDRPYVDEVLVVLDEPTPETRRAVEEGAREAVPPVRVMENERRMGIGYAIRRGLEHCLRMAYEVVVVMAGNGKDDPREIPRLLRAIEAGYDYVQGSRFLPGGRYEKLPFFRGVFVRLWPFIWTLLTGKRCTDVANGFRAYRTRLLKDPRINIWQEWLDHYALEYYLHYKALTLGYRFCEVPVSKVYPFRHRGGYSKIKPYRDWVHIVMPLILLRLGARK